MITFDDESLFWSEEHSFWTRMDNKEWWWSHSADTWRWEVESGVIGGLFDNSSIRDGELLIEYAHLDGWRLQKSKVSDIKFDSSTPLFLPVTNGAPIIVNGYLVGACVNQHNYDYTNLKWSEHKFDYTKLKLDESLLVD